jgi:hypothetical protein
VAWAGQRHSQWLSQTNPHCEALELSHRALLSSGRAENHTLRREGLRSASARAYCIISAAEKREQYAGNCTLALELLWGLYETGELVHYGKWIWPARWQSLIFGPRSSVPGLDVEKTVTISEMTTTHHFFMENVPVRATIRACSLLAGASMVNI